MKAFHGLGTQDIKMRDAVSVLREPPVGEGDRWETSVRTLSTVLRRAQGTGGAQERTNPAWSRASWKDLHSAEV